MTCSAKCMHFITCTRIEILQQLKANFHKFWRQHVVHAAQSKHVKCTRPSWQWLWCGCESEIIADRPIWCPAISVCTTVTDKFGNATVTVLMAATDFNWVVVPTTTAWDLLPFKSRSFSRNHCLTASVQFERWFREAVLKHPWQCIAGCH